MIREPRNAWNTRETVSATQIVAGGGAVLLVAASCTLGSYFGYVVGNAQHWTLGVVFAGAALGGELLKPFAVSEAIAALSRWQFLKALSCLVLATTCILYSLTAELSLAAGSRGDLAASRGAVANVSKDARADRERAEAELGGLAPARPSAEIKAEITILKRDGIYNRSKQCTEATKPESLELCSQIDRLAGEEARAQRRSDLEQQIRSATTKLDNATDTVRDADPGSTSLAAYARDLGYEVDASRLFPWLALIPVVFLELGSALAVVVVRRTAPGEPQRPGWLRRAQPPTQSPVRRPAPSSGPAREQPEGLPEFAQRIADLASRPDLLPPGLIIGADGYLWSPQRVLAGALGYRNVSKVNRQLRDAAKAGLVDYRSGPTGTAVKVLVKV